MNRFGSIGRLLVAPLLAGALVVGLVSGASAAQSAKKLDSATLNGSGSTFQMAFDQAMIQAFTQTQAAVTINYSGGGSGTGRTDFANHAKDFAGTDAPYGAKDTATPTGQFFYIPTVSAPITVSYNLPTVKKLRLSGPTIAGIFSRTITSWDAPEIKKDNPGAKLPATPITVVVRNESSGTTQQFTNFLVKAGGAAWTRGAGSTHDIWPAGVEGGQGNPGVAQAIKATDGTVGYVDFSDAKAAGLELAQIKNAAGKFIKPSLAGTTAALQGLKLNTDLTYDPIYAPGAKAYPISAPTWVLAYATQSDAAKGAALKGWLTYILGDGQKLAKTVNYAALPKSFIKKALATVKKITVG